MTCLRMIMLLGIVCVAFLILPASSFVVVPTPLSHNQCPLSLALKAQQESSENSEESSSVRFLGRGQNAIVRPGVLLIAPQDEFHHFLRESAVFIYGMGYDDDNDDYLIRGVIIDHPTAFSIGEMTNADVGTAEILNNPLFRGGDTGGDNAVMFHSDKAVAKLAGNEMIGASGIYQGGLQTALDQPSLDVTKFKFFFNYMEFTEDGLEQMLRDSEQDGDGWVSLEVPPEIVLNAEYGRGEAWANLRNKIRSL